MNWPLLLIVLAAVMAYSYVRHQIRGWIVDRWLADRLSNRQVAGALVMTYVLPLVAGSAWIAATTPDAALPSLLVTTAFVTLLVSGVAGLLEYASVYGVKQRMRTERGIGHEGIDR